jgi:hypothetical protein
MKQADKRALEAYPIDSYEGHDDMCRQRGAFAKGYEQAEKDTIERACQILYDWNKQMTEMFGAKAVLSCNQFTIDVDRFRKILELE